MMSEFETRATRSQASNDNNKLVDLVDLVDLVNLEARFAGDFAFLQTPRRTDRSIHWKLNRRRRAGCSTSNSPIAENLPLYPAATFHIRICTKQKMKKSEIGHWREMDVARHRF